jgi:hypothetical protein
LRKHCFSSQAVDTTPKQVDKPKSTAGIPPWISAQQQHELGTLASDSPMARAATLIMDTPAPVACSIASRTACGHVVHGRGSCGWRRLSNVGSQQALTNTNKHQQTPTNTTNTNKHQQTTNSPPPPPPARISGR